MAPATGAPSAGELTSPEAAAELIRAGRTLSIAGDARLLDRLPRGNWIAGTIPYFMGQEGGTTTRTQLFVTQIPTFGAPATIGFYDADRLERICVEAPDNGFTIVVIPAFSNAHAQFARGAPGYEDMYIKPLIGWIAGIHLSDLGRESPAVYNGVTGEADAERAIVMHVPLPADKYARVDIINLFTQGDGDRISFPETGFSAETCVIDGQPTNFADYLTARAADTRFPLVADYCGAMVNVSIKDIDREARRVDFYAPVFNDVEYRLARSIPDYVQAFARAMPADAGSVVFSCNCILNYLYSELEGKRIEKMLGPMTFGEIAYQLLNQTLVYMTIEG